MKAWFSDADFARLAAAVRALAGVRVGPEQRASVERKLSERAGEQGFASIEAYLDAALRKDARHPGELEEIVEIVTIRETYFFREEYQIDAFYREYAPKVLERRARAKSLQPLLVLSAGCATGEEAHTLAMCAIEALGPAPPIRVFGVDISRRCVQHARRGVYGASSFRSTSPERKRRFFQATAEGQRVTEEVRGLCAFSQHNLLDADPRTTLLGPFDAIFCRNVLIYMDDEARDRVVRSFHERLSPCGLLLLGHSESLVSDPRPFELHPLGGEVAYARPQDGAARGGCR